MRYWKSLLVTVGVLGGFSVVNSLITHAQPQHIVQLVYQDTQKLAQQMTQENVLLYAVYFLGYLRALQRVSPLTYKEICDKHSVNIEILTQLLTNKEGETVLLQGPM